MLHRAGGRHGHFDHAGTLHAGGHEGHRGRARGAGGGRAAGWIAEAGGTLIAYYLTSGDYDTLLIFQAPSYEDACAGARHRRRGEAAWPT